MVSCDILIVDDQPGIRSLLKMVFVEEGYRVATATNGLEAVEKTSKLLPRLIIMDIRMPVMDGVTALKNIKTLYPRIPVILMTAYADAIQLGKAKELGAEGCIYKPFDVDNIRKRVLEIMDHNSEEVGNLA
ncbi:response regulator [Calderihabitans maritimus]|uniref:Stage 0 sporulation protein A homolog n=1 Tax=Calderihabitans maritimus TaxID=1246530 RepID=A0A1Z5HSL5_9FIRM|nr:response regulator [Calderihabitans maritimus]GAW92514.1 response regulator with CheY-like receiver, AAA-type ATPase, and DNA-binding domains [Calderihabitans maritimus]